MNQLVLVGYTICCYTCRVLYRSRYWSGFKIDVITCYREFVNTVQDEIDIIIRDCDIIEIVVSKPIYL
jgi:hypothetical protein